jgi:hypothetical protein
MTDFDFGPKSHGSAVGVATGYGLEDLEPR